MTPEQTQKCHDLFIQYNRLMYWIAIDILEDKQLAKKLCKRLFFA